jgi:penicillin-binding protein 2
VTQLSGPGSPVDSHVERRITGAAVVILGVWLLLLARLFYLQVAQGERYAVSAERNSVRTHRVEASRGMILDRNGEILVDVRPSADVSVVPSQTADLARTVRRVAALTGADANELAEKVGDPRGSSRFRTHRLVSDMNRDAAARLDARLWALSGVYLENRPIRLYRFGDSASHVLGWLGEIDKEQLERREYQGYRRGDVIGRKGIERLLDRDLRGRAGGRNVLVDAHGRELEELSVVRPQPGLNVVLTLDHRLQLVAEAALDRIDKAGVIVGLDPRNGEVLVLASRPAFDPNKFAIGIASEDWKSLRSDPRSPLHHRALQGQYPPGSTYKVISAIAALEDGVFDLDDEVFCNGSYRLGRRRYRCWRRGGHGSVDLHRALVQSCDVFFYKLAEELENRSQNGVLGVDRLAYYARMLGLGAGAGLEIPGEKTGLVPTSTWKARRFGEPWVKGETLSVAIGQGFNLLTPLQLAQAYAAIASGGVRYRPFVVKRVERPDGELVRRTEPEAMGRLPFKPETIDTIRAALRGVVHEPRGTGSAMRRLPFDVEAAGKTGTAQVVNMKADAPKDDDEVPERFRDHAWFAAYLPAENPRLVISVLVEHGGHGGSAAAPIAAEVARAFLENEARDAEPDPEADPQQEPLIVAGH